MNKNSVELRLPASTSNCGPGFDTLSIGLKLYNFCRLTRREDDQIHATGGDASGIEQMVQKAADYFFRTTQNPPFGFDFDIWGEIPPERGLGSSSTVVGGVFLALNHLHEDPLDIHACVRALAHLDNAPDNVCALVRGGFCISRVDPNTNDYADSFRFPIEKDLSLVVASPEIRVRTPDARAVLPDSLPFSEVISSINGLAYLVAAFAKGDYERLRGTTADRIHQPFRRTLNPFVDEAIAAGVEAGAYAGWLSGSGSSVVCASSVEHALPVREAMESIYQANGIPCRMHNLSADNEGAAVLENE
ncbi:homoserine kinase [Puniceicoccus vermicola]|uniref:Homoserine kinase n=1 Tax=Puniceicoccus vermicola TaxID=388746 RepID=A0A7X1AVQ6_9BACT|nr:homoserine kinase [Puniceicoccus vermicola]MBC2600837.1 homoserine kinase [Puniceicoccus vermicola]